MFVKRPAKPRKLLVNPLIISLSEFLLLLDNTTYIGQFFNPQYNRTCIYNEKPTKKQSFEFKDFNWCFSPICQPSSGNHPIIKFTYFQLSADFIKTNWTLTFRLTEYMKPDTPWWILQFYSKFASHSPSMELEL